MKKNCVGEIVVDEEDLINFALEDKQIHGTVVVSDKHKGVIDEYNQHARRYSLPRLEYRVESELPPEDFVAQCRDEWFFPEYYRNLDIENHIIGLANTKIERNRVNEELELFREKKMLNVLRFMLYFVDTCRKHDLVWGVGRGSSVASYVLYLLGVHKINSIEYELDIREFLK